MSVANATPHAVPGSPAPSASRSRIRLWHVGVGSLLALASSLPATAQSPPDLGTAAPYALLGTNVVATSGTVTCTDTGPGTAINGNVGTTFNTITNNGCTITGAVDAPVSATVVADFNAAYSGIDATNVCTGVIPTVTSTLAPGVYCSAAGTTLGAGVILTLDGSANDVWVFRVGTGGLGALTLTSAQVVMANSANACNVFWKTAEAATLTDSDFVGTILSGAAISMSNGSWLGRGLAMTDVTITDAAPLTFAGCAAPASVTVRKDFSDNSPAAVLIGLSCTSGTVDATPLNASEGAPAMFTVSGADPVGTTCMATETVPSGYVADEADCAAVALGGSCTITNTVNLGANTITVNKDFIPNSTAAVLVSLACTSGAVTSTPLPASEAAPAIFNVTGATPGATCAATEAVPAGYVADQAGCASVALDGSCTITNSLVAGAPHPAPANSTWALLLLAGLLVLLGGTAFRMATRKAKPGNGHLSG
ncbi:ice-binding family protein [Dokdonella sp.]|uniref:ice-binding family protein n=1 Tax=Dokdonella sp. TaxID=2291710 RepID=UPI003783DF48